MPPSTEPISPSAFAAAIHDLPLDTLHTKAAELRNSLLHLRHSNDEMLPFAEQGDQDCKEAMVENLGVINRLKERVGLLRKEVEGRGMAWTAEGEGEGEGDGEKAVVNGHTEVESGGPRQLSGRLTDEELRRRLEAQMGEEGDDGDGDGDGVHL